MNRTALFVTGTNRRKKQKQRKKKEMELCKT